MTAASSRGARQLGQSMWSAREPFLALSGISSLKQKTVGIRAQLCKMAEEIIICWNEIALEVFRRAAG